MAGIWLKPVGLGIAVLAAMSLFQAAGASPGGPVLELQPSYGACTSTISAHATGLTAGRQIYLTVTSTAVDYAVASGAAPTPVLLTFDSPANSTWDFTLPAGAGFLCDEFANPDMRLQLSTGITDAGEPIAGADFARIAPDPVPSGPQITLTPDHGDCAGPVALKGSGFPPNTPIELVLGPLFSLPGSGGGDIGVPFVVPTSADGTLTLDRVSVAPSDFEPPPIPVPGGASLFSAACRRNARLLVTIGASPDAPGGRTAFAPATAVFRGGDAASGQAPATAPAAGSAGPQHSDSHAVWFYAASAVLLLIAIGALASVVTSSDP